MSLNLFLATHSVHSKYKLYTALYKWCTGEQQSTEFSANAYLDVYLGHVNTLKKHIWDRHAGAFHLMMADIYKQAKYILNFVDVYCGSDWSNMAASMFKVNQVQPFQLWNLILMFLMVLMLLMVLKVPMVSVL